MKKSIISKSKEQVLGLLEDVLHSDPNIIKNKITSNTFHLRSRKNYGSLSMIGKERYSINGRVKEVHGTTEISYKVHANATFSTFSIVLPIMLLPLAIMGLSSDGTQNNYTGIVLYLLISAITVFSLLRVSKGIEGEGERDFEVLIDKILNC